MLPKSGGATTSLFTFKKNVCREKKGGEATLPAPPDAMCMASEDHPSRRSYPCTIANVQPLRDDVLYTHMVNVSVPSAYKMYIKSGSYKVIRTSPCILNRIQLKYTIEGINQPHSFSSGAILFPRQSRGN